MKTKSLITIGLAFLALTGMVQAQQNYYHFDGAGMDHGYGNEVLQTQSTAAVIGNVVAGAALSATNVPTAFIAKYDNAGAAIWHRFYRINAPAAGNICEAVGVVEATTTAVPGFGMLCYTNAAPAQTVLIKTDVNGNFLWRREIGTLRGASVAYDATLQRFLCLTQVFANNTNQLNLVVVDANTGAVVFSRFLDGCGNDDAPVTVIHDVLANQYICLGNSRTPAGDMQMMISRVTPANVFVDTRIFGDPARREVAVDLLRDPAFGGYIVGGYIAAATNVPFFCSITFAGVVNIALCNNLVGNNTPRRMAFIGGRYMMVGSQVNAGNQNGLFISVTPTFGVDFYRLYGQPAQVGNEELRDISPSNVVAMPTLMCGTHQRTVAWLGSAALLSYNWLVFANNAGAGTCPQNLPYTLAFYAPISGLCELTGTSLTPTVVTSGFTTQTVTPLDECTNPNRIAGSNSGYSTLAQVYPNPAANELNVNLALETGATAVMNLYDMTGRLVRTEQIADQSGTVTISVADLPSGIYFCKITSGSELILEQKLVIAH